MIRNDCRERIRARELSVHISGRGVGCTFLCAEGKCCIHESGAGVIRHRLMGFNHWNEVDLGVMIFEDYLQGNVGEPESTDSSWPSQAALRFIPPGAAYKISAG